MFSRGRPSRCSSPAPPPARGSGSGIEIERSPADTRDYRAVALGNGLEALVVSDPDADRAAAALDVNVGSANDPETRPGFAHFLEHLLFLGTEKYPEAQEYDRFLTEHGGFGNARTGFAHTTYFFEVDAAHLEGALDRFAQFFINPRFDRDANTSRASGGSSTPSTCRAAAATTCEASRRGSRPSIRAIPSPGSTPGTRRPSPSAPAASSGPSSSTSTRTPTPPHLMKLVVLGREPLDDLERLVRTRFAAVKRRPVERLRIDAPLFREGFLPARLDIAPIREVRTLSLSFPIPPLRPHYRAKPLALVSHLVGHEGRGSLLSALKERGWAEGLGAGAGISHPGFATFGITIRATEAGIANADEVVALVFAYLDLVRAAGRMPRYRDELVRMAEIGFRFMEKAPALDLALALAGALHRYPAGEVLAAPYRYDRADPTLERRFLSALTPDRVLVTVTAKGVTTDSVSPFFEAPFRLSAIPPETVARWRDPAPAATPLALPEPNPFVPGDLSLIEPGSGESAGSAGPHPVPHRRAPRVRSLAPPRRRVQPAPRELRVRGALAGRQRLPASCGAGLAAHPHRRGRPHRVLLPRRPCRAHVPSLPASSRGSPSGSRAGATSNARCSRASCRPCVRRRSPPRGSRRSGRSTRGGSETSMSAPPYRRAMSEVRELLLAPGWPTDALLAALDEVGPDDLRDFVARLFARGRIVALAHGNVTARSARALGGVLEEELLASMRSAAVDPGRVARLEPGARFARWLDSRHEDHAVVLYRQGHRRSPRERARLALIGQAIGSRFFHELRTERKIGYVVFVTPLTMRGAPGLALVVQSDTAPPEVLRQEVEAFLDRFDAVLRGMSDADFERHRRAVESALLEAETRLDERTDRYWGRDREGAVRVRLARAAPGGGTRDRPGRARGGVARGGHGSGLGPRSGRGRLRPEALR